MREEKGSVFDTMDSTLSLNGHFNIVRLQLERFI